MPSNTEMSFLAHHKSQLLNKGQNQLNLNLLFNLQTTILKNKIDPQKKKGYALN